VENEKRCSGCGGPLTSEGDCANSYGNPDEVFELLIDELELSSLLLGIRLPEIITDPVIVSSDAVVVFTVLSSNSGLEHIKDDKGSKLKFKTNKYAVFDRKSVPTELLFDDIPEHQNEIEFLAPFKSVFYASGSEDEFDEIDDYEDLGYEEEIVEEKEAEVN